MSEAVQTVARRVDEQCYTTNYRKEGCSISMSGVPADRVVIDLDCGTLQLHDTPRCDFLFVGADSDGTRVAPIELKNGRFSGSKVADQLQGARMRRMDGCHPNARSGSYQSSFMGKGCIREN